MIFENNYAYAGTTAIIYNYELEDSRLMFEINNQSKIVLSSSSLLKEIGIEYKKDSDSSWNSITIADETVLNSMKNGTVIETALPPTETSDYLYDPPVALLSAYHMAPIRIVIKNLDQGTTYTVRSYFIKNTSRFYFNECTVTTMTRQDVYYECTEVTGGTEAENLQLKENINKACDIYNSMTSFKTSMPGESYLGTKNGGKFTAELVGDTLGGNFVANNYMKFKYPNAPLGVICHEMAHNLMKKTIDETWSEYAYNKIVKFMEFATHSEAGTWRWLSNHNYPVISSKNYTGVGNYLVAAACYVCRDASDRL
jgi:hypothetical protein